MSMKGLQEMAIELTTLPPKQNNSTFWRNISISVHLRSGKQPASSDARICHSSFFELAPFCGKALKLTEKKLLENGYMEDPDGDGRMTL